ncbi:MAG: hypothetical protein J6K14_06655 [Clostridia bacterium]|nr:hypothetical protein [Clostridia bacterium]
MEKKLYVTYEEFGAVGDGMTDDHEAIIAAHAYANEEGLPVKARDDATYYIGGKEKPIIIKTSTDFGKAHFIIDDRHCESSHPDHIFFINSDFDYYSVQIDHIDKGQTKIEIPHEGNLYVKVVNDKKRVYIRYGANENAGTPLRDYFTVDKDGNIGTLMPWQFDKVTEALAKSTDEPAIDIHGGIFTNIVNLDALEDRHYYGRGILCTRSHVHFYDMVHYVEGEPEPEEHYSSPYGGFLNVDECYDVTVEDLLLTPHRTYYFTMPNGGINAMGSYGITACGAIGLKLIGLRQTINILDTRYWGLMGSNFCKDMLLERCEISRFDAHQGVHNVTMRDCTFGHVKLQVIGFGEFLIERCKCHGNLFMLLRSDYGSFFDGNVTARDCEWKILPYDKKLIFLAAGNNGMHDFGYPCMLPKRMHLENILIDDTDAPADYQGPYLFNSYDTYNDAFIAGKPFPYMLPESVTLKNVRTASGRPLIHFEDKRLFPGVKVTVED